MNIVTPKFLTKEVAQQAIATALQIMQDSPIKGRFKRTMCHIIVMVPEMDDASYPAVDYPHYHIRPHVLFEMSVGKTSEWSGPYEEIARCKALQLWHGRNDDRTDNQPHLLFPGDTPYWGGVKRNGIVVACSGVQPWFDKMISGVVADLCVGLAYDAWMTSSDRKNEVDLLT